MQKFRLVIAGAVMMALSFSVIIPAAEVLDLSPQPVAAVEAAIPDHQKFPSGCAASTATTKQAVKIFRKYNFNTPKEVECGNAVTSDLGDAVLDKYFAYKPNSDPGAVEGMANLNKSVVFFNKAKNYGVCFALYDGNNFSGQEWRFYLKAKPSGYSYVVGQVSALSSVLGFGRWQSMEAWPADSNVECGGYWLSATKIS